MFCETSTFHTRFDTRFFCRWRGRRDVLGADFTRPLGAHRSGQADGLRQRQPERAAVIGRIADMCRIIAASQRRSGLLFGDQPALIAEPLPSRRDVLGLHQMALAIVPRMNRCHGVTQ